MSRPSRSRPVLVLGAAVVLGALPGACTEPPPRVVTPRPGALAAGSHATVRYEVVASASGVLDVVARFPAGTASRFFVEPGAEPFVRGLQPEPAGGTPARGVPFELPCDAGCELRYRFDLPAAAEAFDHVGYAARAGEAWLAPPSTWLLHPREGDLSRPFELRVAVPPGERFASGLPPLAGRAPGQGEVGATLADLPSAPYAALGTMRSHLIDAGGAVIDVVLVGPPVPAREAMLVEWVREASLDVSELLGAPVVPHAMVLLDVRGGRGLSLLTALGNGGASIHAPVGRATAPSVLARDWRMTHEFVHLGSPGLDRRHTWFSEGLATYFEPIARVRRGRHPEALFWQEMVESLPLGQPGPDDAGLDRTPTWGRTYWGGALFCLLADVEARRRTGGERSLLDAVRAVHRAGGDVRQRWSMLRVVEVGDAAIGTPVLAELYARHRHDAVRVDLDALWRELGVVVEPRDALAGGPGAGERPPQGGAARPREAVGVTFDDDAPLADARRAITALR